MRLFSFEVQGRASFGVQVDEDRILDLGRAQEVVPCAGAALGGLEDFIAAGERALEWAQALAERARAGAEDRLTLHRLDGVKVLAPVRRPEKIICVGLNYMDHCREQGKEPPSSPIIFPKFANCLIGSGDPIVRPPITSQLDWEGELAVVVGRRGKRIPEDRALEWVFGYTIMNDVSARDVQYADKQWTRGKVSDTFAPLGPCIVTADEIPDPQSLKIQTRLNGRTMQDSSTAEMIFPVRHLLAYLSRGITFAPGDVLSTGTPDGVGMWRKPPVFMQPGDVIRVEIEKIGVLENPVHAED
ncbi:MAG: hypothetical protein Kow0059_05980 [Candidatus Sumerlaeia bacterium]